MLVWAATRPGRNLAVRRSALQRLPRVDELHALREGSLAEGEERAHRVGAGLRALDGTLHLGDRVLGVLFERLVLLPLEEPDAVHHVDELQVKLRRRVIRLRLHAEHERLQVAEAARVPSLHPKLTFPVLAPVEPRPFVMR